METALVTQLRELDARYQAQVVPAAKPLVIEGASGATVRSADGQEFIDCIAGISVVNCGHNHPKIVRAIVDQAQRFGHVMPSLVCVTEPNARLAEMLVQVAPQGIDNVFYTNSGTESVEGALKLARKYTGRSKLVYFEGAFHGRTFGSLSVSSKRIYKDAFEPLLPDTVEIPLGDVSSARQAIDNTTAGVIIEPVQGEAGVRVVGTDFLRELRQLCDRSGALLIFDEVQCGMGRTGKMFALEHSGVVPDVLCLAKGIANGLPLGAFMARKAVMDTFMDPPLIHNTTFGGNPISCAAAIATLRVIQEEGLLDNARERGRQLKDGMSELKRLYPDKVKDVRGLGLMTAIELSTDELADAFVGGLFERRILVIHTVNSHTTVRVCPPLVISEQQVDRVLTAMNDTLKTL